MFMITRFMLLFAIIIFNVQAKDLDINAKLPGGDYVLQNIDGKNTSLDKVKKANNIEDIAAKNCTILLIVNDIAILYSTYILYKYCFLII